MKLFFKYRPILWTVYLKPAVGPTTAVARDVRHWAALDQVEALRKQGQQAWALPG